MARNADFGAHPIYQTKVGLWPQIAVQHWITDDRTA